MIESLAKAPQLGISPNQVIIRIIHPTSTISTVSDNPYTLAISENEFQQTVLEGSHQRPVLVDFWAGWCQPCRTLMPILSQLAAQYRGKFILAKINTEENPSLASSLGIRSLPTVHLYIEGEMVDEFMGALPEAQIRAFLDKHIPNETDLMVAQAEQLATEGDGEQAANLLNQAAAIDPDSSKIKIAQARLLVNLGHTAQAGAILDTLDAEARSDPAITALIAQLEIEQRLKAGPDSSKLEQRLNSNENDSEARYLLAMHAVQQQDYPLALELLLKLMQLDRGYNDDAARKAMLEIFDLLGGSGELVSSFRNKLFTLLH